MVIQGHEIYFISFAKRNFRVAYRSNGRVHGTGVRERKTCRDHIRPSRKKIKRGGIGEPIKPLNYYYQNTPRDFQAHSTHVDEDYRKETNIPKHNQNKIIIIYQITIVGPR